jgi:hypothetical protein
MTFTIVRHRITTARGKSPYRLLYERHASATIRTLCACALTTRDFRTDDSTHFQMHITKQSKRGRKLNSRLKA